MTTTKTVTYTDLEIHDLAARFETASLKETLKWAFANFAPRIAMTSSFGAEGVVLIDHLAKLDLQLPVIYLDTGFHFPETHTLTDRLQERYKLEIRAQEPGISIEAQDEKYGEKLYKTDPDTCCRLRKVEPLKQALNGLDAWLVALRRNQSPSRANIKVVEWNAKHNLVKINPLARWTRKDIWDYTLKHKLPYNELYDEGYASIGCFPCTKKINAGQHERSGRWVGQGKVECGIHL